MEGHTRPGPDWIRVDGRFSSGCGWRRDSRRGLEHPRDVFGGSVAVDEGQHSGEL